MGVDFGPRFLGQVRLRLGATFQDQIKETAPAGIQPPAAGCVFIGSSAIETVGSDAEKIANQAKAEGWTVQTTNDPNGFTYYFWACNPPAGAQQPTTPEGKIAQAVAQGVKEYAKYKMGPTTPPPPVLPPPAPSSSATTGLLVGGGILAAIVIALVATAK